MSTNSSSEKLVKKLISKGFTHAFTLKFDSLFIEHQEKAYLPEDFTCQLENEGQERVYSIEAADGKKGIFIHNHDEYALPISIEMIDTFRLPNKSRL